MKRPTKILFLVEDFDIGGQERVVETLFDGLDRERFAPGIWCLAGGGRLAEAFLEDGKNIRLLNFRNYHNPVSFFRLARLIRKGRFQIVHTHGYFAGTLGRAAAYLARTPVIISHVHTVYRNLTRRNLLAERMLVPITDQILCCSKAALLFLKETAGIPPEKLALIYNGAVCKGISRGMEQLPTRLRICVVASLVENKGHRVVMEAIARLRKRHPALVLTLVGEGPLEKELRLRSEELGIADCTQFLGLRDDVQAILSRSEIAVLPSLYREGLGLSLLEAMCQEVALVGSDIGGIPEVIQNGFNGYLVKPGSVSQLEKSIERLISDPELRRRMGLNGRRLYEKRFSGRQMIHAVENTYSLILGEKIER